jgi:hypothetical protein
MIGAAGSYAMLIEADSAADQIISCDTIDYKKADLLHAVKFNTWYRQYSIINNCLRLHFPSLQI